MFRTVMLSLFIVMLLMPSGVFAAKRYKFGDKKGQIYEEEVSGTEKVARSQNSKIEDLKVMQTRTNMLLERMITIMQQQNTALSSLARMETALGDVAEIQREVVVALAKRPDTVAAPEEPLEIKTEDAQVKRNTAKMVKTLEEIAETQKWHNALLQKMLRDNAKKR